MCGDKKDGGGQLISCSTRQSFQSGATEGAHTLMQIRTYFPLLAGSGGQLQNSASDLARRGPSGRVNASLGSSPSRWRLGDRSWNAPDRNPLVTDGGTAYAES